MRKWFVMCLMLCLVSSISLAEGSWSQINVSLDRPDGWSRIVTDSSAFALGDDVPYEADPALSIRSWGTYPSIDGSTVCVPMAMEFAREWLNLSESDLSGFVSFSTTPTAYERLINNTPNPMVTILSQNVMMDDTRPIDIVLGTAPNQDERDALERAGKKTVMVPVCYDAFIFMLNKANPVNSLSAEQIRDMYSGTMSYEYDVPGMEQMLVSDTEIEAYAEYLYDTEGKPYISNWKDVGGADAQIHAYQRPHGSGSQT
ncbi:MAG: substrate-binding domain-containing protein, partial [Clostridia bacterium]|nr:substrate-binding domain-containing protein [Clostridia bacterium]